MSTSGPPQDWQSIGIKLHKTLPPRSCAETRARELLRLLESARARIEKEENWTQGELARGPSGMGLYVYDPAATCWCAEGALAVSAAAGDFKWTYSDAVKFLGLMLGTLSNNTLYYFNDNHTHAEVLALFDKSISDLRQYITHVWG